MTSKQIIISIIGLMLFLCFAYISKWQSKKKQLEYEKLLEEIQRENNILEAMSNQLRKNQQVDSESLQKLEQMANNSKVNGSNRA